MYIYTNSRSRRERTLPNESDCHATAVSLVGYFMTSSAVGNDERREPDSIFIRCVHIFTGVWCVLDSAPV